MCFEIGINYRDLRDLTDRVSAGLPCMLGTWISLSCVFFRDLLIHLLQKLNRLYYLEAILKLCLPSTGFESNAPPLGPICCGLRGGRGVFFFRRATHGGLHKFFSFLSFMLLSHANKSDTSWVEPLSLDHCNWSSFHKNPQLFQGHMPIACVSRYRFKAQSMYFEISIHCQDLQFLPITPMNHVLLFFSAAHWRWLFTESPEGCKLCTISTIGSEQSSSLCPWSDNESCLVVFLCCTLKMTFHRIARRMQALYNLNHRIWAIFFSLSLVWHMFHESVVSKSHPHTWRPHTPDPKGVEQDTQVHWQLLPSSSWYQNVFCWGLSVL